MLFINGILTTLMIGLVSCAAIKEETVIENNASNKDCPCTLIIHCISLPKMKREVTESVYDCSEPNLVRCCGKSVDDHQTENVSLLAQNTILKDLSAKNLTKQTSMNVEEFNLETLDLLKNESDIIIVYPWVPNSQSGEKFRSRKLMSTQSAFNFEDQEVVVVVYPEGNANNNASEIEEIDGDLLVAASTSVENTVLAHIVPLLNDKNETNAHDAAVGVPSTPVKATNVTETTLKPETKAVINGNPHRRKYRRRKTQRKIIGATIQNNTLQISNNKRGIEKLTLNVGQTTKMNHTKLLMTNLTSVIEQNLQKTLSKRLDMNNTKVAHNIFDNSRRAVLFKERNKKKLQPVMNLKEMMQDTNFSSVDNVHRHVVEHMRGKIITSSTSYQSELPFWPELKTYKKNDRSDNKLVSHLVGVAPAQKSMEENTRQSESANLTAKETMQDQNGRFAKRGRCRFMTCARSIGF